tara:strand:- start:24 stop:173 length:150 start_codon:yes stop_codon:yes gene_type:complete
MGSKMQLAVNLGETYLVTKTGVERLGKTETGSGHIIGLGYFHYVSQYNY